MNTENGVMKFCVFLACFFSGGIMLFCGCNSQGKGELDINDTLTDWEELPIVYDKGFLDTLTIFLDRYPAHHLFLGCVERHSLDSTVVILTSAPSKESVLFQNPTPYYYLFKKKNKLVLLYSGLERFSSKPKQENFVNWVSSYIPLEDDWDENSNTRKYFSTYSDFLQFKVIIASDSISISEKDNELPHCLLPPLRDGFVVP